MTSSRHSHHPGNKQAVQVLREQLEAICGAAQLRTFPFADGTYFNVEAEIAGTGQEMVVVGAHLDSTAANETFYDPAQDAAPGADDDLSGVVGVLLAARVLRALANSTVPERTIRFVLFNAEEQWMRGSWAYADHLKELEESGKGHSVVAMLAMDMIGWHPEGSSAPLPFEIHGAGTAATEYKGVSAASAELATTLVEAAGQEAPGRLTPQVYPQPGADTDPATNRSDHSSFHYHGWPACLVCEDLWGELVAGDEKQQGNPDYHKASDVLGKLDMDYLADVARTVAGATWMIARP